MFNIVLVHPEIPPNTGNVIRLAANTGCRLHLVRPLGFELDDARLRRAGLDYHEYAELQLHDDWAALRAQAGDGRMLAFTKTATTSLGQVSFAADDWLVFGCETRGLPAAVLRDIAPPQHVRLPMRAGQRSLNLSNAVAIAVFEGWRQLDWAGAV